MHTVYFRRQGVPAPVIARRTTVSWAARLACGAALTAALVGFGWAHPVAAQDEEDTIVHTAGGATLIVSPGNASAISAVAEAHASPGHARTKGAAAEAIADCKDGALTRGAAALAVAHPDEGALAESAVTEISAKNKKNGDKPIRKIVEKKCHEDDDKKEEKKAPAPEVEEAPAPEPVQELPTTGIGAASTQALASLLVAASAAAALGAVGYAGARRVNADNMTGVQR